MIDINNIITKFNTPQSTKPSSDTATHINKQVLDILNNLDEKDIERTIQTGLSQFKIESKHILSQNLPTNIILSEDVYQKILTPYNDGRNYLKAKQIGLNDEISNNIGWKLHLNIAPENAQKVSDYLTQKGYHHKFLSGGELIDGKVFTIYIGSFSLAKKIAETLSVDLENYLCKPQGSNDIEFAKGIVGRFYDTDAKWQKNWDDHITMGREGLFGFQQLTPNLIVGNLEQTLYYSFKRLLIKHKNYFYSST